MYLEKRSMNIGNNNEKDIRLLELFKSDREKAFRLLFESYYIRLCIYSVELTDSFEMAEDIVQDFFIYFWEKKIDKKININLRNYLYLSVRNASILAIKKEGRIPIDELVNCDIDIEDEVYDEEELCERKKRIMEELEKLPSQELRVVKAILLENKKYKEAAEEFDISVNTLKTHLSRALKKLRKSHSLYLFFY